MGDIHSQKVFLLTYPPLHHARALVTGVNSVQVPVVCTTAGAASAAPAAAAVQWPIFCRRFRRPGLAKAFA